eukprot:scaffold32002_cov73-Cyclotella_meneghiniana.AAC.2
MGDGGVYSNVVAEAIESGVIVIVASRSRILHALYGEDVFVEFKYVMQQRAAVAESLEEHGQHS